MAQAVAKPQTVDSVELTTPADVGDALALAVSIGWRGTAAVYPQADAVVWSVEFNSPAGGTPVTASLGDVVVCDGERIEAMTRDRFDERYDPA